MVVIPDKIVDLLSAMFEDVRNYGIICLVREGTEMNEIEKLVKKQALGGC